MTLFLICALSAEFGALIAFIAFDYFVWKPAHKLHMEALESWGECIKMSVDCAMKLRAKERELNSLVGMKSPIQPIV